jgi:LysM repeat protein
MVEESATPAAASVEVQAPTVDGYRIGRWARLALTVTVLTAIVVLTLTVTAGSASSTLVDVTVGPGDTLWSIAATAAPDRDPRAVIDEIRQLNTVPDDVLPVGVVLRVPAAPDAGTGE